MSQTKRKSVRVPRDIVEQRKAVREALFGIDALFTIEIFEEDAWEEGDSVDRNIKSQRLFQIRQKIISTYIAHKNRSLTDSLEAYQYGAEKQTLMLQRNGRIPTKEVVLHFFKILTVKEIQAIREKIFRILRNHKFQAVAAIELTRTMPRIGRPNNTVHFHLLTDDKRSEEELRAIFNKACIDGKLDKGYFRIDYGEIEDGYWYFEYHTKFDRKNKELFEKCRKMRQDLIAENGRTDKMFSGRKGSIEYNRMKKDIYTRYKSKIKALIAEYDAKNESNGRTWNWKSVLLFEPRLGIKKFYTIGKWYDVPKGKIWDEITAAAKANAEAVTGKRETE